MEVVLMLTVPYDRQGVFDPCSDRFSRSVPFGLQSWNAEPGVRSKGHPVFLRDNSRQRVVVVKEPNSHIEGGIPVARNLPEHDAGLAGNKCIVSQNQLSEQWLCRLGLGAKVSQNFDRK